MALLQLQCSCLSSSCSSTSSIASTVSCLLQQPQRAGWHVQRAAKSQLRSSVVCCASSGNSSSANVVLPREESGQQVFKDDSNGVVCYYDEHGDVTCEGWDEGPHFQPDPQQQPTLRRRRRFTPSGIAERSRSGDEAVSFENVKGRMGDSLGEVANESFESSEL